MREYLRFLKAPDEFHDFLDEFQEESPRAAAVLGAAYLDDRLRGLIEASVATGSDPRSLPSSLFQRIQTAHAFGLITTAERDDLHRVRKIRNRFAHEVQGVEFEQPDILEVCHAFECVEERFNALDGLRDAYPEAPRALFDLVVGLLAYYLDRRCQFAKPVTAAQPPLWPFDGEERDQAPLTLA